MTTKLHLVASAEPPRGSTSTSENEAGQFLIATIMAISDGERRAAMGGLMFLFRHIEEGGDLPKTIATNMLETE